MMRFRIGVAALVLALGLTGCATSKNQDYHPYVASAGMDQVRKLSVAATAAQQPYVRKAYENVIAEMEPGSAGYVQDRQFADHAMLLSGIATTYLLEDDAEGAKRYALESFRVLEEGEDRYVDMVREQDQDRENMLVAASVLMSMAGTTAALTGNVDLANSYTQAAWSLQPLIANSQDSTAGLKRFIEQSIETDEVRMPFLPTMFNQFSGIGWFETPTGHCTGFLAESLSRLALTNAHCVTDAATGVLRTDWPSFRLVFENALSRWEVPVVNVHLHMPGRWDRTTPNDWAILELEYSPAFHYGPLLMDIDDLMNNDDLQMDSTPIVGLTGYSGDLNDGRFQSLHWGCTTLGVIDGILPHTCKRYSGASGSPMLLLVSSGFQGTPNIYAVGIHSGVQGGVPVGVPYRNYRDQLRGLEQSILERDFGGDFMKQLMDGKQVRGEHIKTMMIGKRS
jgi:V8-like Glu-specific endopeptidase